MTHSKLVLVNPVNPVRTGLSVNRSSRFPPLGLGVVAALTPPFWEVELVDENFETFSYRPADLVGITAFTSSANRAYQIADAYRQRGVPVVMGGIHASMCTAEALRRVDAVVVGEAESVWDKVLADAAAGKLCPVYHGQWQDLAGVRPPASHLYSPRYEFASVQTSRGCPLDCDFCSVSAYNGRRYRRRPPHEVLDELEALPQKMIFFVDDNIFGYGRQSREAVLELFQGMVHRGLNKLWLCQASINIAEDPEVLDWAARAGCRMVFLGLEAEDAEALADVNKRLNLKAGVSAYDGIFQRIHQAGIAVLGALMFGMDGDTAEKVRRRAEFFLDSDLDVVQTTIMTPLPGTRLFERLKQQGRLLWTDFPRDWDRYNLLEVVHQPAGIDPAELSSTMRQCVRRMYDLQVLKGKMKRTKQLTGRGDAAAFAWQANISYREIALADSTYATSTRLSRWPRHQT